MITVGVGSTPGRFVPICDHCQRRQYSGKTSGTLWSLFHADSGADITAIPIGLGTVVAVWNNGTTAAYLAVSVKGGEKCRRKYDLCQV